MSKRNNFVFKGLHLVAWVIFVGLCIQAGGLISHIAIQFAKNVSHHGIVTGSLNQFWSDGQAFILMGAVIYIIATIFKKGVDIQYENDLTV